MTDSSPAAPSSPRLVMGIDVSKRRLDLAYSDGDLLTPLDYSPDGLRQLVAMFARRPVDLVVVESTGGVEQDLVDALLDASVPVTRVQPGRVRYFARASAQLAKTDAIDALVLAQFGLLMKTRLIEKRSETQAELDALVTCRRQLIHVRTEQANRRRNVRSHAALKAIDAVLKTVEKEIRTLDEKIKKLIDSDDDYRDIDRILQSVPGVGVGLSATILSSLGELGSMTSNQAAALIGVAPFNADSGQRSGKRHIRGGRVDVRNAFYMSANAAIKYNPVLKAFADRLAAAGKPFKVVLTACMRKLASYLNVMLKQRLTWDQLAVVRSLQPTCK